MSPWLRIILTWLLALALPLQGHAAQSMRLCGPGHDSAAGFASLALQSGAVHVDVQVDVHADLDADAHAHHAASAPADGNGQGGHDGHGGEGRHGKCSVCASCCGALALTGALRVFEPTSAPTHYRAEPRTPRPGTIPGGLERPPRNPLA